MKDESSAVKEAKNQMRLRKKRDRQMGHNLKDYEEKRTKQKTLG